MIYFFWGVFYWIFFGVEEKCYDSFIVVGVQNLFIVNEFYNGGFFCIVIVFDL